MQVGAENRKKLFLAIALMAVALVLLGRFLFGTGNSPTPAVTAAAPTTDSARTSAVSRKTGPGGKKDVSATRSLDPTLRYDWLRASEDTKYQGTGRNIFRAEVDIPKPIKSVATDKQAQVNTPPQPPPPPPINLKFFGYANRAGESKRVFLSQGEDVFVAHEGDIIDRRYRIVHITPTSVEVEDVLNNNRQSIPLTQG